MFLKAKIAKFSSYRIIIITRIISIIKCPKTVIFKMTIFVYINLIQTKMTDNSLNHKKWDLMRDLSNEQSERLAKFILNDDKKKVPNSKVLYENFVQMVRNNEVSIADRFDEYNKSGKYTEGLPTDQFSQTDILIFTNILITKTAMLIVGTYYYTD
jgi:hypothetical protein